MQVIPKGGVAILPKSSTRTAIYLGAEWPNNGVDVDIACVAMKGAELVALSYYDKSSHDIGGYLLHSADNRTGADTMDASGADTYDEWIKIVLGKVPTGVDTFLLIGNIFNAAKNFGHVNPLQLVVHENDEKGPKLASVELSATADEPLDKVSAVAIAIVKNIGGDWKVKSVLEPIPTNDLGEIVNSHAAAIVGRHV